MFSHSDRTAAAARVSFSPSEPRRGAKTNIEEEEIIIVYQFDVNSRLLHKTGPKPTDATLQALETFAFTFSNGDKRTTINILRKPTMR